MTKPSLFLATLALALACVMPVSAQTTANSQPAATELSILIGERQIKFTPLKAYEQIRLEVFNNAGELIFASNVVTEADLNYNLHDSNGQPLAPGLYAYTLSIKAPGVEALRQHQGHFILEKSNDQIWLTTRGESSAGAEVTGGALTIARSPERTTAGAGYVATGRTLSERAGTQRDTKDRTVADSKGELTREDGGSPLRISGAGTTNQLTRWLDGPNGVVGDSLIHQTASGDIGVGTASPGGVFDLQRNSASDVLQRFWNTGTGGSKLRYVASNTATAQVQFTGLSRWWSALAATKDFLQFRTLASDATNDEAQLAASPRMTILQNGNIGIGTTAPAERLDVAGNIAMSGFLNQALRHEATVDIIPNPSSPNVIGGFLGTGSSGATPGNRADAGVLGAAIGGGGFNGTVTLLSVTYTGDNSNRVTDAFGVIAGGLGNRAGNTGGTIDDSRFAVVGGGRSNVATGIYSTIAGGQVNTASGSSSTVAGGTANLASHTNSTIPGGLFATASHFGEMAYASGGFINGSNIQLGGSAQTSTYVLRSNTTDTTQTEMSLNGSTASPLRITFNARRAGTFDILLVAEADTAGTHPAAMFRIDGGIARADVGNVRLFGGTVTQLGGDLAGVTAANIVVDADTATQSLRIRVTGLAATNIRWVATVRTAEVQWH